MLCDNYVTTSFRHVRERGLTLPLAVVLEWCQRDHAIREPLLRDMKLKPVPSATLFSEPHLTRPGALALHDMDV